MNLNCRSYRTSTPRKKRANHKQTSSNKDLQLNVRLPVTQICSSSSSSSSIVWQIFLYFKPVSSTQLIKSTSASRITAYHLGKDVLASKILYGTSCLVGQLGISGMWENPNNPIYADLRLFCHAVFGFCCPLFSC